MADNLTKEDIEDVLEPFANAVQSDVKDLKRGQGNLSTQIGSLEQGQERVEDRLDGVDGRLDRVETGVNANRESLEEIKDDTTWLRKNRNRILEKLAEEAGAAKAAEEHVETLAQQVKRLTDRVEKLEAKVN